LKKENLLQVNIYWSPALNKETYSAIAFAVTSENSVGPFDILPTHANFITQVFNKIFIRTEGKEDKNFEFKSGVLEVSDNKVNIFLGI
jgi:F0F1-type ATP synthase epsilon subunit